MHRYILKNVFIILIISIIFYQNTFAQLDSSQADVLYQQAKGGDLEAVAKIKSSAESGDKFGQMIFGLILINGNGIKQDDFEATKWFTLSAKQGVLYPLIFIAKGYENQTGGLPKSPVIAASIYSYAYAHGVKSAKDFFSKLTAKFNQDQINEYDKLDKAMRESNDVFASIDSYKKNSIKLNAINDEGSTKSGATWKDSKTGLMWTVCNYGEVNPPTCSTEEKLGGINISTTWFNAISEAKKARVDGYEDWRIPTIGEILTVYKCLKKGNRFNNEPNTYRNLELVNSGFRCPEDMGGSGEFISSLNVDDVWSSSASAKYGYDDDRYSGSYKKYKPRLYVSNHEINYSVEANNATKNILLVRGGVLNQDWIESLKESNDVIALVKTETISAQAARNKSMEDEKNRDLKRIEYLKNRKIQFDTDTSNLRKNVKKGDQITKGLVLEVKGELIQVQTYRDECNLYTNEGRCNMFDIKKVPSGTEWVRRDDILPLPRN